MVWENNETGACVFFFKKCTLFECHCILHEILIDCTVFSSPTGDGAAILRMVLRIRGTQRST